MAAEISVTYIGVMRVTFQGEGAARQYKTQEAKLVLSYAPESGKKYKKTIEGICRQVISVGLGQLENGKTKMEIGKKLQLNISEKAPLPQLLLLSQPFYADDTNEDLIVPFAIVSSNWIKAKSGTEFLRELKDSFLSAVSIQNFRSAKDADSSVAKKCSSMLTELMNKYGNDTLNVVKEKVGEVTKIMQDNVDTALNQLDTLHTMEGKASELVEQSESFVKKATDIKRKFCGQYWKLTCAIIMIVVLLLTIIVVSVCLPACRCGKSC
jgi:hypothetical protein